MKMVEEEYKIKEGFSYRSQLGKGDDALRIACIERYKAYLEAARRLQDDFPIFLDTNVLLGYYLMPVMARRALYRFLQTAHERIFITDQVKREFLRHHRTVKKNYQQQLTLETTATRHRALMTMLSDYQYENEDVLAAYPDFEQGLESIIADDAALLERMQILDALRIKTGQEFLDKEDIIDLLDTFQQLPSLTNREFKFLKREFDQLKAPVLAFDKGTMEHAVDAYLYKHPNQVFPGIGDIKNKPKHPYGDYCIFHEMMRWQAALVTTHPLVFLTNDVTKRDWVNREHQAYVHYLEVMQLNTQEVFYILHSETIFTNVLGIDCAHLVLKDEIWEDVESAVLEAKQKEETERITPTTIQQLLVELYPTRTPVDEPLDFWEAVIEDIQDDFGITTLYALKIDALEGYSLLIKEELRRFEIYDQLDALEKTLVLLYD